MNMATFISKIQQTLPSLNQSQYLLIARTWTLHKLSRMTILTNSLWQLTCNSIFGTADASASARPVGYLARTRKDRSRGEHRKHLQISVMFKWCRVMLETTTDYGRLSRRCHGAHRGVS